MSHLKQENDSPLQLNTKECTFHLSFYIFLGPLTCSQLKSFMCCVLGVENISRLLKQKLRERNFARHFMSLKYISFC